MPEHCYITITATLESKASATNHTRLHLRCLANDWVPSGGCLKGGGCWRPQYNGTRRFLPNYHRPRWRGDFRLRLEEIAGSNPVAGPKFAWSAKLTKQSSILRLSIWWRTLFGKPRHYSYCSRNVVLLRADTIWLKWNEEGTYVSACEWWGKIPTCSTLQHITI